MHKPDLWKMTVREEENDSMSFMEFQDIVLKKGSAHIVDENETLADKIHQIYRNPTTREKAQDLLQEADLIHVIRKGREFVDRFIYVRQYGFAVPCVEMIEMLDGLGPIVEVGAGTGHLSTLIKDCVPTDIKDQKYGFKYGEHVQTLSAMEAVKKYPKRAVLCSWPSYDEPWAYHMIKKLEKGRMLAYVGEYEGCTADRKFHRHLEQRCVLKKSLRIPNWPGLHDMVMLYQVNVRK